MRSTTALATCGSAGGTYTHCELVRCQNSFPYKNYDPNTDSFTDPFQSWYSTPGPIYYDNGDSVQVRDSPYRRSGPRGVLIYTGDTYDWGWSSVACFRTQPVTEPIRSITVNTMSKAKTLTTLVACGIAVAGVADSASATTASAPKLKDAVLFYDAHPANGGRAGYVLVARLTTPLPKGQHIVGRLGTNFPVSTFDRAQDCYSGGIPPAGTAKSVRHGKPYRVRLWIGKHPDPDHGKATLSVTLHLHATATGKAAVKSVGCRDVNGYLA